MDVRALELQESIIKAGTLLDLQKSMQSPENLDRSGLLSILKSMRNKGYGDTEDNLEDVSAMPLYTDSTDAIAVPLPTSHDDHLSLSEIDRWKALYTVIKNIIKLEDSATSRLGSLQALLCSAEIQFAEYKTQAGEASRKDLLSSVEAELDLFMRHTESMALEKDLVTAQWKYWKDFVESRSKAGSSKAGVRETDQEGQAMDQDAL